MRLSGASLYSPSASALPPTFTDSSWMSLRPACHATTLQRCATLSIHQLDTLELLQVQT